MAVRHGYGKVAGTDALVFAYDTGDTVNSYKGRPTANYGPADFANWTPEAGTAGDTAERIPTGNYYKGQPTYNCRVDTTQQYRGIYKTITDLATIAGTGGTITVSCMVKNNNSRTDQYINAFIGHDFSSVRWVAANSDWQKVQWTVDAANLNNNTVEFRPVTRVTDEYLEMTMPMVEVNVGSASQFVNGTRSVSGSLLDLTGLGGLDLSNVSFDSNAQIDFDGTDDRIQIADSSAVSVTGAEITLEVVVRKDTNGSMVPIHKDYQYSIRINSDNSITYADSSVWSYSNFGNHSTGNTNGSYAHIVATKSNGIVTLYSNGEVVVSKSFGGNITHASNDLFIGAYSGTSNYMNGAIPIAKIYNRALTADEVRNNYRHYKNRFNI